MIFRKALLAVCVTVFCVAAQGQTLWQGSEYGMSPEQVTALFAKAQPPSNNPSQLQGGAVELLRIDQITLVNKEFIGRFFFKDNKLVQVMLSIGDKPSFTTSLITFDALTDALRAKYGPELSRKISRGTLNMRMPTGSLAGRTSACSPCQLVQTKPA
jgi:hypothetical protein